MVGDVCSKNWEVEDNKRSYHNSLDNQKYQLLLQWSCRHNSKTTYRIILIALLRLDKINTLDNVCKLLHAQSERAVLSRVLPRAPISHSCTGILGLFASMFFINAIP